MARKATHQGECQLCGKTQKLPGGLLSIHGYTIQWNMFNGTCPGTQQLPYELSCELIKQQIPSVKNRIEALETAIAKYSEPATTGKGWYRLYLSQKYDYKKYYAWKEIEIQAEQRQLSGNTPWTDYYAVYNDESNKIKTKIQTYKKDVLEVATELNQKYVDYVLKGQLQMTKDYLKWLSDRVQNWKLAELKPVEDGVKV